METQYPTSQIVKYQITWNEIKEKIKNLDPIKKYYGVPRGGQYIAAMLNPVDTPDEADIIIDDLIDSGQTKVKYEKLYNKPFIALFDKYNEFNNQWLVMPWEVGTNETIEHNIIRILQYYNYNINDEGLKGTPQRYIKALNELLICKEPKITLFEAKNYNNIIYDKNIDYYSLCEHHIIPFFGKVKIGYIPNKYIVGLSKLSKIVNYFSKRLNTQEYFTENIANYLVEIIKPKGVAVIISGRHLCKEMRGAKQKGEMITTSFKGIFENDFSLQQQFLLM